METNLTLSEKQIDYALAEHAEVIRAAGRATIENVLEIGHHLTDAKKICGHGNWLPWLKREFSWTEMTATRFMNVYALQGRSNKLLDLDLPVSSLYLLAAPSTPEAARQEVLQRAAEGEKITHKQVKQEITEAKEAYRPPPQSPSPAPRPKDIEWGKVTAALKIVRSMNPDTFEQFAKDFARLDVPF